jgi:hypothetical protein
MKKRYILLCSNLKLISTKSKEWDLLEMIKAKSNISREKKIDPNGAISDLHFNMNLICILKFDSKEKS